MPQGGLKPEIYDSLLLKFAVAHEPTRPPWSVEKDNLILQILCRGARLDIIIARRVGPRDDVSFHFFLLGRDEIL